MGVGRWRERRVLLVVAALAVLGTSPAVAAIFGVSDPWVIAGAVALAAVVAALASVWQDKYKRASADREERARKLQDALLVLGSGRLPKVRDMDDPVALGVHPAISADGGKDRLGPPAYVVRDQDEELRNELLTGGFVLLVGDSTAGKSRTAYEAIRRTLADHVLVAPRGRSDVAVAVEHAMVGRKVVLWLSDLENLLGRGGLTREHVVRLTSGGGHHRIILATMRSAEQARWTDRATDDPTVREAEACLEQARQIRLARAFGPGELDRAHAQARDPRIAMALEHSDEYGIAEYLASGPELRQALENAWDIGVNPRGAALVEAAIDCRRAGFTGPLPPALLEELHETYLRRRGGDRLRPEPLSQAWEWVKRPRRATTAMLSPHWEAGGGLAVFDYLVDVRQRDQGPADRVAEDVVRTALRHASRAADADGLAATAFWQGRYLLAVRCYRTAVELRCQTRGEEHPDTLASRNDLALALMSAGKLDEALVEGRAVVEARARVLGEEHPDTLASRNYLVLILRDSGRWRESEALSRAVLRARRRVLGEEHEDTLSSRNNRGFILFDLGRFEEAVPECRAVLRARQRVLGEEHEDTLVSRMVLALNLWGLGRLDEAEAYNWAALEARRRLLDEEHPDTLISRMSAPRSFGNKAGWRRPRRSTRRLWPSGGESSGRNTQTRWPVGPTWHWS